MMYGKYFTSVCGIQLNMKIAKIVGNNLKSARKAAGMTQRQVAETMLMTQQQYSRFENGVFELNYEQIIKLCGLLDVTPDELFDVKY